MRPYLLVIFCGGSILGLSFGVRQVMGLLVPIASADTGWTISSYALALAIQNLVWGFVSPVAGSLADKHGPARVLAIAGVIYCFGLVLMATASSELLLHASAGGLIGLAVGSSAFPVVLGAVGRLVPDDKRAVAIAWTTAGGSLGQFLMAPVTSVFLVQFGWYNTLFIFAALVLMIVPLAMAFSASRRRRHTHIALGIDELPAPLKSVLRVAQRHQGFLLLNVGFFVCGFHIAFIAVHLPTYITTLPTISPWVIGASFSAIGLFNVIGSLSAGYAAKIFRPKWALVGLYGSRCLIVIAFLLLPKTDIIVMAFASLIGLIWLATVPLTSATVGMIFGPRWLGTLFGLVMLSHQAGAFLGAYIGGVVFDFAGNYTAMWISVAVLSGLAALLHVPINDKRAVIPQTAITTRYVT
ncbi:MAG: MFS transporter [Alphaproteobacteria bacterium]|nr:MFS transporter [Alphaproteobacteria bacterium]